MDKFMKEAIERAKAETFDASNWVLLEGIEYCPKCNNATQLENNGAIICEECGWIYE